MLTGDWVLLFYGPFVLAIILMIIGVVNKNITLKLISIGLFIVWIMFLFFL
ncbi:MAG: hypothetical protein US31_C0006G0011 [Berkelbacteria bacterium GW2011_GWA1_36_9]|uniref:Uncharacterized protein n=1 Tax=Berkelbacteria bacterium GW2011_GWA1_36_9 TaxID=1618331 RepID=A0A0G0FWQ9_9BACT|nr:MAG: hypothetical protein US31_C0006G0011 [Berkelbacteria bacterium GW2011_GWA1_36_9]